MTLAFSMVSRLHHNLLLAFSPSYRRLRQRIGEIGQSQF